MSNPQRAASSIEGDAGASRQGSPSNLRPIAPQDAEAYEALPQDTPTGLVELTEAVIALAEQLRKHDARAAARERVIDHLHAEVERLRRGEQSLVLRPVITDLQRLRNQMLHQAGTLPSQIRAPDVVQLLQSFALSAELALERCGSLPVRPVIGGPFLPREHRAVGIEPVMSPEDDGVIIEVLVEGYRDIASGRVTAPAHVRVGRFIAPEHDPASVTGQPGEQGSNE